MIKEVNNLVTKSNKLIDANYKSKLTIREQKIILYIISKIRKDDNEFKRYSLPIKEFSKMMGLKGSPKYDEIKKITKNLLSKVIEINEDDGLVQTHWLSEVKYHYGHGVVEFTFPPKLKPYLLQLKREFTSYKLKNIMELKSGHSIRIYELLKKWEKIGEVTLELDDLKERIGMENKHNEYSNFKLRVLKTAESELKSKTDIFFTFDEIKKGRKVVAIHFHIETNPSLKIENINEADNDNNKENKTNEDEIWLDSLHKQLTPLFSKYGYDLELNVVERWIKLAEKLYGDKKYVKVNELCGQAFKQEGIENHLGFVTYILKQKVEYLESGKDPNQISIEKQYNYYNNQQPQSKEVVPDWFEERKAKQRKEREKREREEREKMKLYY